MLELFDKNKINEIEVGAFSGLRAINKSILNPNIMGPSSYIPFMECNHAILSMKNKVNGVITINDKKLVFDNGDGTNTGLEISK